MEALDEFSRNSFNQHQITTTQTENKDIKHIFGSISINLFTHIVFVKKTNGKFPIIIVDFDKYME